MRGWPRSVSLSDQRQLVPLGEIVDISIGRTPPRGDERYWTPELVRPFCTIADMNGGRLVSPTREGVTEAAELKRKANGSRLGRS